MAKQSGAKLDIDAVGGMGKKIGTKDAEDQLEGGNCNDPDHQDIECAHAAMNEHLVDDDLKEQRRNQGKQLKEERGNEHLTEKAAVFLNRVEKPVYIEPLRKV